MEKKQAHVLDDRAVYERIERAIAAGEMEPGTDLDIPAFLNNLKARHRVTVRHNRVVFDDGRELVITLRPAT